MFVGEASKTFQQTKKTTFVVICALRVKFQLVQEKMSKNDGQLTTLTFVSPKFRFNLT